MKAFKVFAGIMTLLVSMPLWYVLMYMLLERVQATQAMWVMFWIYMPVGILVAVAGKIAEALGDD